MKKWIGIQVVLVLLIGLWGQVSKGQFSDVGVLGLQSWEDTYKMDCGIMYFFGDNKRDEATEKELYDNLCDYEEEYVRDSDLAPIVIVGKSTGKLENYTESLGQEVLVEKVLKGSGIEEGERYFVYGHECFEEEQHKAYYTGLKNTMNPKDRYLIFLEPSQLNGMKQKNTYSLLGAFFSYLNLSKKESRPIKGPIEQVKYGDLRDVEFFCGSKRIERQMGVIKEGIIKKFQVD